MRIAVLSDLHVGPGSRAHDLAAGAKSKATDKDYVRQFCEFLSAEGIRADYIVVPGDVSDAATPEQFETASRAIEAVASQLEVGEGKIMIVPGNHDLDWIPLKPFKQASHAVRRLQAYLPAERSNGIVAEVLSDSGVTARGWTVWEHDDLVVVGHNSAWADGPHAKPHYGSISSDQLAEIRNALLSVKADDKYRLFLIHHHPFAYDDPLPFHDFSQLDNSAELMELLAEFRFDVLVHGHKHVPRFQVQLAGSRHLVPVLCAGSFSKALHEVVGDAVNQFHMVEIAAREPDGLARGRVLSWSFSTTHGWRRSAHAFAGIDHSNAFGRFAHPAVLAEVVRGLVARVFETRDYVTWDDLLVAETGLEGVPNRVRDDVLEQLSGDGLIDVVADGTSKSDRIVLLKRGV